MRLQPPLPVAAVAAWLPDARQSCAAAVASGLLAADTAAANGFHSVTVSDRLAPPQLAVLAARRALASARWDPATLDLVAHAWTYYQGHDFWSPPHFIASAVGATSAVPVGVQQMCNGGAAAIELAASRLVADSRVSRALVTTADCFGGPGYDRWGGDSGTAYGDGATALLLGGPAAAAPLRLLATSTVAVPQLEAMHRGDEPFAPAARLLHRTVSTRRTMKAFFAQGGRALLEGVARRLMGEVLRDALDQAGVRPDDPRLRVVALPRLGRSVMDADFVGELAAQVPAAQVREFGRDTGHLGAGDPLANLAQLHNDGVLRGGAVAVLLSVGAGFTWSALVLTGAP